MADWRPLSQRGAGDAVSETLYEGVPAHLRGPLLHWFECQFDDSDHSNRYTLYFAHEAREARALRIANRPRVHLQKMTVDEYDDRPSYLTGILALADKADQSQLLDLIDAALAERNDPAMAIWAQLGKREGAPNTPEDLDVILRDGGSAYKVNDQRSGLERRVPAAVREAVRRAADSAANKDGHLDAAWRAAYGIRPEPTVAYAEAVKAIEAAVLPIVLPNDPRATLGKAIAHLRSSAAQWELGIADTHGAAAEISPLLGLLGLIWHGHRDRHAGTPTAVPVTSEAAEMAVHAAAMIVYWLGNGALRRRR